MEQIERPTALPVRFENIPTELKKISRWVMWKYLQIGEKFSKVPLTTLGKGASSTDPKTWTDFFSAQSAFETGSFDGVGIVFDGTGNLTGIDIDDCLSAGVLSDFAKNIVDNVAGYCEVSPSGTGVKIFTLANTVDKHVDHAIGLEVYIKGRYFTVTGNHLSGCMPLELQDLSPYIPERTIKHSGDAFSDYKPPVAQWTIDRVEHELLPSLDPENYTDWINVGMCLHHQFEGDYEALELFDRWSQRSAKHEDGACQRKWDTFKGGGLTIRSLIFLVGQSNLKQAIEAGEQVLEPNSPVSNAKVFLSAEFEEEEGTTLVHYAGDFYVYRGTHYAPIEEATIRAGMYGFLSACKKMSKGNAVAFNPTPNVVNGILDATKALTHLEYERDSKPPVWLKGFAANNPDAENLIAMRNGLYNIKDVIVHPHSLGFFNTHSLPFEYDPSATCPQWERFLDDIWSQDQESKDLLMEYIGYVLSNDRSQQKYLMVIGPRRAGKGTINRIIVSLLGRHNVVSPQLDELADTFALQSWLGKPLASISDARLTGRNSAPIVSQLLRIVGNDPVSVNRKNKESLEVFLPTRIIMYSNEALQLSENSGALTGRILMLQMTKSFFGSEDSTLDDKLAKELSGIFNMAMAADKRRRSREGERFVQPKSALETLETAIELANPLVAFIDDVLEYEPGSSVNKDDLFVLYRRWCSKQNLTAGAAQSFKRRFMASTQDRGVTSYRSRTTDGDEYFYQGVKLKPKAQKFIDSMGDFEKDSI